MTIEEALRQMRDPEADNERLLWADAIEAEIEQMQKKLEHCRKAADTLQKALQNALLYGRPLPEIEAQEQWSWARHVEVAGGDLYEDHEELK